MDFECVYCGKVHHSENGTGSDVACCGERGHSKPVNGEDSILGDMAELKRLLDGHRPFAAPHGQVVDGPASPGQPAVAASDGHNA